MSAETDLPLEVEQRRERRSDRWLFARELTIVLAVAGAVVAHALH